LEQLCIERYDFQQLIVGTAAICTDTWPAVASSALFLYSSLLTRPALSPHATVLSRVCRHGTCALEKNNFINNNILPTFGIRHEQLPSALSA
jgi:hypothetical protein